MFIDGLRSLKTAVFFLLIISLLTGIVYPFTVTGVAQLVFPWQANGSFLTEKNRAIGSALIGQAFNDPRYFWGRPSATTPTPYNASASTGSNLSRSNPQWLSTVQQRIAALRYDNQIYPVQIPIDLITASGSGLDPEISPNAAFYQVERVALARGLSHEAVDKLVYLSIIPPQLGVLGEPRVNVLKLNQALEKLTPKDSNGRQAT